MEIISSTTVSRETEQGYLEESYTLAKQFGVYAIIKFSRVSGLGNPGEASVMMSSTNDTEVRTKYKEYCKLFKA